MRTKLKPLSEQVIVVTGASSGIGLATARRAAREGAAVVLVARNEPVLRRIADEIDAEGGRALPIAADVADRDALEHVAATTIDRYDGFDTWVNNAGVGIFGRIEDGDERDFRRLFDTNFWGMVNGSLVAAKHLRGRGGAIVNVGSIAGDRASPMEGIYAASKHAVKGFTDAYRMELERDGAPISVTLVKPAAIGTPFPQHVKNVSDREPRLPPPIYDPEEVARAILYAASHPVRDLFVGGAAAARAALTKRAPRLEDKLDERLLADAHFRDEPARPRPSNLYEPGTGDGLVRGDHGNAWIRPSLYTRLRLARSKVLPIAGAVAALLTIGLLVPRARFA